MYVLWVKSQVWNCGMCNLYFKLWSNKERYTLNLELFLFRFLFLSMQHTPTKVNIAAVNALLCTMHWQKRQGIFMEVPYIVASIPRRSIILNYVNILTKWYCFSTVKHWRSWTRIPVHRDRHESTNVRETSNIILFGKKRVIIICSILCRHHHLFVFISNKKLFSLCTSGLTGQQYCRCKSQSIHTRDPPSLTKLWEGICNYN